MAEMENNRPAGGAVTAEEAGGHGEGHGEGKGGFRLNGWHVLGIFVGAFGVIIAVNVIMATKAIGTFPGLEVKNSYVASQEFDQRLADQTRLGWTVYADDVDGMVHLIITDPEGNPVRARELSAIIGRTTRAADDVAPVFAWNVDHYEAPLELGGGRWIVRVTAIAEDGTEFIQRINLHVEH